MSKIEETKISLRNLFIFNSNYGSTEDEVCGMNFLRQIFKIKVNVFHFRNIKKFFSSIQKKIVWMQN